MAEAGLCCGKVDRNTYQAAGAGLEFISYMDNSHYFFPNSFKILARIFSMPTWLGNIF